MAMNRLMMQESHEFIHGSVKVEEYFSHVETHKPVEGTGSLIASALAYAIESSKMQLNSPLRNMIADFFHSLNRKKIVKNEEVELLIKETMQKIKTP